MKKVQLQSETMLPGGISQGQLDVLKGKHLEIHIVTVHKTATEALTGYFKKPSRDVLANVINMSTEGKVFEAREFLANNTKVAGDDEILTNEDVAIAAQIQLWKSLDFLKAEVRKY
ncbi:MAG: hypothetical protein WKF68_02550 [Daejeonella sp.]